MKILNLFILVIGTPEIVLIVMVLLFMGPAIKNFFTPQKNSKQDDPPQKGNFPIKRSTKKNGNICHKCHKPLPPQAVYCPKCGEKVIKI